MNYQTLREKHSRLTYTQFDYTISDHELMCEFTYTLSPEFVFKPKIRIPLSHPITPSHELETLLFNIGILEGINYWKAAVPQEYCIEAGSLDVAQVNWWHDLFISSLGEFYYVNSINFLEKDFLKITSSGTKKFSSFTKNLRKGNLILSSGGKDSAITLELLKNNQHPQATFTQIINNPTRAPLESALIAGYQENILAYKSIDPLLLELNKQGYLQGHMPFSAMVSFLAILAAYIYDFDSVIASNESGANEGNIEYLGKIINHQYAKSYEYESQFRQYVHMYISPSLTYYSILRPLNELQIAYMFSKLPQYHKVFRSCNQNIKKDSWCGTCAKCAFIFLVLSAFTPPREVAEIFGSNLLENSLIQQHIRELVGLTDHKPFECVGTQEESMNALLLVALQYKKNTGSVPPVIEKLIDELHVHIPSDELDILTKILSGWNNENFIPEEYIPLIKGQLQKI